MIDAHAATSPTGPARPAPLLLDGRGGAVPFEWPELTRWSASDGRLWIDLALPDPDAVALLKKITALDRFALSALLAEETRPRWLTSGAGLLLILRGINLNPGAEPEDMVSLRLWSEPGLLITTHRRDIVAIREVRAALLAGHGAAGARDLLVGLTDNLVTRLRPVVERLDDQVSELEDWLLDEREDQDVASSLAQVRRSALRLRRHLAPQRQVLGELEAFEAGWLRPDDRRRLREIADRLTRDLELLDAVREHALVTQDELQNRAVQRTARTTNQLTLVAGLFLPLTFVTGLFGMNLGGIPGAGEPWAFALACAGLLGLLGLEVLVLRRLDWLRGGPARRTARRPDEPR